MGLRSIVVAAALVLSLPAVAVAAPLIVDDITQKGRYQYPGTSAVVDTIQREIRLPKPVIGAGIIDARPTGYELVTINGNAVESYSFDGQRMVQNAILSLTPTESPLAVAGRINQTDVVAITTDGMRHYGFNGQALVENPFLAVSGLSAPLQVATRPGQTTTVAIDATGLVSFSFDGAGVVPNPSLSLSTGVTNPVAFAVHPRSLDVVILDADQVTYYGFNGTNLAANPMLSVTGLTDPVAIQMADDRTLYIAEATGGIVAYSLDGTGWTANTMLSVPEAAGAAGFTILGDGRSVAVRYADEIRIYQFDGTGMTENTALRITGLEAVANTGSDYASSGIALSRVIPVSEPVEALVLYSNQSTPPGTAVSYAVSGDAGATWNPARLGKGVLMPLPDTLGAAWRAVLSTSDRTITPLVLPDIELRQVWRPDAPTDLQVLPRDLDGLVTSATPTLLWQFTDRDEPDDHQTAFQIQVYDADSGHLVFNTGKISSLGDADLPPDEPGPYPLSAPDWRGEQTHYTLPWGALSVGNRYYWRARVWDRYDLPSLWSDESATFEVLALDNLQLREVWVPPSEGLPPLPTSDLPVPVQAGAQFAFTVDSIGALELVTVDFSDGGSTTTIPIDPPGSPRNTWSGTYYTHGSTPPGTILTATFTGWRADGRYTQLTSPIVVIQGSVYDDFLVILTR